jgi:CheY-like chemotaxis protein
MEAASLSVLVVEDDADSRHAFMEMLSMLGHNTWGVRDASGALLVAQRVALDLVLLDIGLPDLDGFDLARRLRRLGQSADLRIVAVTGRHIDGCEHEARECGIDDWVVKPVGIAGLQAVEWATRRAAPLGDITMS